MKDAADYVSGVLKRVDKSNLSVTHTVIVPDRTSLEAERALLKAAGGSFNIQVKTFRRFANDVLPKYEYLSKQAGVMALSGIIRDNRDKLTCFTKGTETAGFVADMYDTVSMMKYCKVSPEQLERDLPKSVKGKVKDIATLYRAYLDFTADRFVDSADKLDLLRENLSTSKTVTDGYFYLYDFDNFSAQEFSIVEQLMLVSKGVTVACCVGKKAADKYLYLDDIYNGLISVCERNGIVPEIIEGENHVNAYARQIGENLYRYEETKAISSNGFAEVFCGATRAQEVYALACKIQNYVRGGGRFRDVYVVTSDINCYFNAVTLTFSEFNIPYFCDRQYALSAQPYAQFILDYLTLCKNNGKLNYVLPFVKNYLFCGILDENLSQDDGVFLFENYCLKYNVSYRYDKFALGQNDAEFAQADAFREKFYSLYKSVKFPPSATVGEYAEAVRKLIEVSDLDGRNAKFCEQQQKAGLTAEAKVTKQVKDKFCGVLTQAEKVLGTRYVSLDEFIKTLTAGVEAVNISVLPVTNDCVIFANMAKARKHDVKFLALLGANYGAMPIVKSDCKLLSDANIKSLAEAGVNVEPQIFTENKRERFSLFQLLQEPSEKLYVSYAESDGAAALTPSPFVGEICRLFTEKGRFLTPASDADEEVYTTEQAVSKIVLNTRKLQDKQLVRMPSYEVLKKRFGGVTEKYRYDKDGKDIYVSRGKELYLKKSATSVSQLTDFFKCPYRFYIQYGLNVKPRSVSELKTADLGNILHAVLEYYVRDFDIAESDEVTAQSAAKCFEEAMSDDFYKGMRGDPQMSGILEQLQIESVRMCQVVKNQLKNSKFTNMATELSFGGESAVAPVEVEFDGGKFCLVGKIDRVDVCGDRFIVIDYKSGAGAAHYAEKELYLGHKLQLPVYVKAAQNLTGKRPAGFYYFNIHNNFAEIVADKVYFYNGRTLDDVETAKSLDTALESGVSEKLGLKLKKDGDLSHTGSSLLADEQFDNQVEYAFELIRQAGNLMQKGYAAVNPYEGVCGYCDYKDICDFGDTFAYNPRNLKDKVTATTIDKTVKK